MSKTPEGAVKDDVKAWLKEIGAWYFMPVKQFYGRVGIPDFIICMFGEFVAVETKRPGNERGSTERQKEEAVAIAVAGGIHLVISNVEQLKDVCYAHPSIKTKLPSRGSQGKPQAPSRAPRASARSL
jgi:hypothetical protein